MRSHFLWFAYTLNHKAIATSSLARSAWSRSGCRDWGRRIWKRGSAASARSVTSVGGPITGKGFQLGIIDDPLKNAEEAQSETIRAKQKDWYGSTFYTRNPLHPDGCAHLTNGHWLYKFGLHQGNPALVQAAPVTVRRDRDRDGKPEAGERLHTGWFGINHHAGGTSERVGPNSAGCQIIHGGWNGQPWRSYFGHLDASRQATFDYYLVDAKALAEFASRR